MELLTAALAFLHVLSAMMWLGGGFLFILAIAPRFAKMKLASSRDFAVTVLPRVILFFQIVAGATILFGILLLYVMSAFDGNQLTLSTTWGFGVLVGAAVAVVAFLFSEFVTVPAFQKLVRLHGQMGEDGSHPPSELPRAAKTAGLRAIAGTGLILVAMAFMIGAGFY